MPTELLAAKGIPQRAEYWDQRRGRDGQPLNWKTVGKGAAYVLDEDR
jgi:hypothetical protein